MSLTIPKTPLMLLCDSHYASERSQENRHTNAPMPIHRLMHVTPRIHEESLDKVDTLLQQIKLGVSKGSLAKPIYQCHVRSRQSSTRSKQSKDAHRMALPRFKCSNPTEQIVHRYTVRQILSRHLLSTDQVLQKDRYVSQKKEKILGQNDINASVLNSCIASFGMSLPCRYGDGNQYGDNAANGLSPASEFFVHNHPANCVSVPIHDDLQFLEGILA